MNAAVAEVTNERGHAARYARVVALSKKTEWQIDRDLLRGRTFDFSRKFLPDGLTLSHRLVFLSADDERLLSHVQGRTYAYIFGLVERFISAKMLDQSRARIFGDQVALEGLVRFSNEEIKHQELFRRMEAMIAPHMPDGYRRVAHPNDVARAVLAARTWAVLALTCHIELFVQSHYAESIAPREDICPLFRDVFQFHWRDECQHVVLDELEWRDEHATLSPADRDLAVDDLIALVAAVDGILQAQSTADTDYFMRNAQETFSIEQTAQIKASVLAAYRWQYIISGVQHPHFSRLLTSLTTPAQMSRIQAALAPILGS
jgi:P-aminobenzoate N-oxygenase AurF